MVSLLPKLPLLNRRTSGVRSAAVGLLLVLFLFMQFAAAWHQHGETFAAGSVSLSSVKKTTAPALHAVPGANKPFQISASDCPLCELAALSVAPVAPVVMPDFAPAFVCLPVPALRSQPFLRFRFCDRSSARAPPFFA